MSCLTYPSTDEAEIDAHLIADEHNHNCIPSMAAQCPVCGSGNTYNETDAQGTWTVCLSCGARSL